MSLDPEEIHTHLDAGTYAPKVDESRRAGDNDGIEGVPTLLVGSERIEGAQPCHVIRDAYMRSQRQG